MTEAARHADFSIIRYAQVWEDADILLKALQIQPEDECLSIASAGDNAFALLSQSPKKIVAVDLNPAQLACVHLRIAGYQQLNHPEFLDLLGVRAPHRSKGYRRQELYQQIRKSLPLEVRFFWDSHPQWIRQGAARAGKFENYFAMFRQWVLPLVHPRERVEQLLAPAPRDQRERFHDEQWDTWRWRLLFRVFFSRPIMGRFGRDPAFFRYVKGTVGERILLRARHALREMDTSRNSYLHWILLGEYREALPFALRAENFERIKANLHRLECRLCTLEEYLEGVGEKAKRKFNLSDIFEYMSESDHEKLLLQIVEKSSPGSRLAYWNMLAPRSRPETLAEVLKSHPELSHMLHQEDQAFFYSAFILEEVQ